MYRGCHLFGGDGRQAETTTITDLQSCAPRNPPLASLTYCRPFKNAHPPRALHPCWQDTAARRALAQGLHGRLQDKRLLGAAGEEVVSLQGREGHIRSRACGSAGGLCVPQWHPGLSPVVRRWLHTGVAHARTSAIVIMVLYVNPQRHFVRGAPRNVRHSRVVASYLNWSPFQKKTLIHAAPKAKCPKHQSSLALHPRYTHTTLAHNPHSTR